MTASMAVAMSRAGFNVAESRLRLLASDALTKCHRNIDRALSTFEKALAGEPMLLREALRFYLIEWDGRCDQADDASEASRLRTVARPTHDAGADHNNSVVASGDLGFLVGPASASSRGGDQVGSGVAAQKNHVIPREPSTVDRAAVGRVAEIVARRLLDTVKTSDGRPWGKVGAHELPGLRRDGALAGIIEKKLGALSNAQRFKTVGELISDRRFEEALREARELERA